MQTPTVQSIPSHKFRLGGWVGPAASRRQQPNKINKQAMTRKHDRQTDTHTHTGIRARTDTDTDTDTDTRTRKPSLPPPHTVPASLNSGCVFGTPSGSHQDKAISIRNSRTAVHAGRAIAVRASNGRHAGALRQTNGGDVARVQGTVPVRGGCCRSSLKLAVGSTNSQCCAHPVTGRCWRDCFIFLLTTLKKRLAHPV